MNAALVVLVVLVLFQTGLLLVLLLRRHGVEAVRQDLQSMREGVDRRLSDLDKATGQVVELSRGVNELHRVLTTPQGRGAFGEMTLERMLEDLFGGNTEMFARQHAIEGGERADAVVFLRPDRSQMVCVDAKFPLENAGPLLEGRATPEEEKAFAKDVRARAEEIRKKYVTPPKTTDFAFMFVPSESVYYLVLKDAKLHEDLLRGGVVPTSPNAFYAYLRALSIAFEGMKIERKAEEIRQAILQVAGDFAKFAEDYAKLGRAVGQARDAYEESVKKIERFKDRFGRLKIGEGE